MTDHEKIVEAYDDALFALLMERVAEEEGSKYLELNEQLKNNPSFEVPSEVRAACLKTIRRELSRKTRKSAIRITWSIIRFVSVIIFACIIMLTAVLAASPALRASTLNFVINILEDHTNITLSSSFPDQQSVEISLAWMPDGYVCTEHDGSDYWFFENEGGAWISIRKWEGSSTNINVDTEDAIVLENVSINGNPGVYSEKPGRAQVTWGNDSFNTIVMIAGNNTSKTDILQIANNINFS